MINLIFKILSFINKIVITYITISLLLIILLIIIFSKELGVGLLFLYFICIGTILVFNKLKIKTEVYILFLIAILIHLIAVLFIFYIGFRPFGGGADFEMYHKTAVEIANRFSHGVFSLQGLYSNHYFPVLIAFIYIITMPALIIGQLFIVWLASLSVIFSYLIVREIGGSRLFAFIIGLIASIYPSYLYFSSVLLKDTFIIPLTLISLFLGIRLLKKVKPGKDFDWIIFIIFYLFLTGVIHLRFYIGCAVLFGFIISWFFFSEHTIKEKFLYGITIIFILGFVPKTFGYGYYGTKIFGSYMNRETITTYREVVYAPKQESIVISSNIGSGGDDDFSILNQESSDGVGSSFVIKAGFENPFTFIKNYSQSFIYSLLGPFPWQIKMKQIFALLETIPWTLFLIIIFLGMYKTLKKQGFWYFFEKYRFAFFLILFSVMSLGALSLYINNFGIIIRIRIISIIALLCVMSLSFKSNKFLKKWQNT